MKRATLDQETANFALERSIERPWFRSFITGLIIFNAAILGVLTYRHSLPRDLVLVTKWLGELSYQNRSILGSGFGN